MCRGTTLDPFVEADPPLLDSPPLVDSGRFGSESLDLHAASLSESDGLQPGVRFEHSCQRCPGFLQQKHLLVDAVVVCCFFFQFGVGELDLLPFGPGLVDLNPTFLGPGARVGWAWKLPTVRVWLPNKAS
jgi:hypothetical protein